MCRENMDYYAIGQRIRNARKAHRLSQEELAGMVGISVTHMSHIETGNTKLSLEVLVDLAQALQVRTDDLLFGIRPLEHTTALDSIDKLLEGCTTRQLRVIEDLIRAARTSLERYDQA